MIKNPKILITTGIYPPDIGGPAKYSQMLWEEFNLLGKTTKVRAFSWFLSIPTGIRHLLFFFYILKDVFWSDFIVALDTYSVALPSLIASKVLSKKIIVRTGGDFLWESYIQRTKTNIKLSEFYNLEINYSFKEKIIFKITKFILQNSNKVVFSTKYQRDIFSKAYSLPIENTVIIENLYDIRAKRNIVPKEKIFFAGGRRTFIKNKENLLIAFEILKKRFKDITLDLNVYHGEDFINKMKDVYCVVVPSISEISPNLVLEAVSMGIPAVVTEDCGIKERLKDVVIWIRPEDPQSIADGIEKLLDAKEYSEYMSRMSKFEFVHSGKQIAEEFLSIFEKL